MSPSLPAASAAMKRAARDRIRSLVAFAAFHRCGDSLMPANSVLAELAALCVLADYPLHLACNDYRNGIAGLNPETRPCCFPGCILCAAPGDIYCEGCRDGVAAGEPYEPKD